MRLSGMLMIFVVRRFGGWRELGVGILISHHLFRSICERERDRDREST
jgi:hypothetical protein